MMSARLKLTGIFIAALVATVMVIGVALSASRTAGVYGETGRAALSDAELAIRLINQAASEDQSLLFTDGTLRHVLLPHGSGSSWTSSFRAT